MLEARKKPTCNRNFNIAWLLGTDALNFRNVCGIALG
jgi:hypothetical protein